MAEVDATASAGKARDITPVGPERHAAGTPAPPPATFATAVRERVLMRETVTGSGESVEIGSIEVPKGWRVLSADDATPVQPPCHSVFRCVLWGMVSPDGHSRVALVSPWRTDEALAPEGAGSLQGRLAAEALRADASADNGFEIISESGPQPGTMPATRRRWLSGSAWVTAVHEDATGGKLHRYLSIDVESEAGNKRYRRAQSGPMLIIDVPDGLFDAETAEAIRQSLQLDPAWLPAWWLAWETRTATQLCTLSFQSELCVRRPHPGIDYLQNPGSLGLWDIRIQESSYERLSADRYDR